MAKKKPAPLPNQREEFLLSILVRGEMYGRAIRDSYQARAGHELPLGSLYTTLDRMEDKGFVKSRMGESEGERGGNRRKHYKLTGQGVDALNTLRQMTAPLSKGALAHD